MSQVAYFAIHYNENHEDTCGYIAYNPDTKEALVSLDGDSWNKKVTEYLHTTITMQRATGLESYEAQEIEPLRSMTDLKLALTLMWEKIRVYVDWSRPVEIDGVDDNKKSQVSNMKKQTIILRCGFKVVRISYREWLLSQKICIERVAKAFI